MTTNQQIKSLVKTAFPNYNGRRISVSTNPPKRLDSYWDGGCRDFFAFVNLENGRTAEVHSNHPFFEASQPRELPEGLPDGIALVRLTMSGTYKYVTVFFNPKNIDPSFLN